MGVKKVANLREESDETLPSVSIVVPAFNNERTIAQTLKSLTNLDYPQDKLEIIVVDDASSDSTAEVALRSGAKVIRREKRGGCAAAKNTGIASAENEVIAFIDSDVTVTKNWLKELVSSFKDPTVGATGGRIRNKFEKNNALEKFVEYDSYYRTRRVDTKSTPGSNSAYRKEVFSVVGKLDPYLGEDPDFSYRVASHGFRVVFNDKAVIYHPFPNTLLAYFKKQVYYGWQRVMIFLLRPQCRSILVKDEHTPISVLLQPFILTAMILSLLFIPIFDLSKFVSLSLFLLLVMLNIPLLHYIYSKEARLLLFSMFISLFRSFAYIIGMAHGLISFLKGKVIGRIENTEV